MIQSSDAWQLWHPHINIILHVTEFESIRPGKFNERFQVVISRPYVVPPILIVKVLIVRKMNAVAARYLLCVLLGNFSHAN